MKKRTAIKYLLSASVAGVLSGVCLNANASAFQLFEYNGVNAGNFGAGAAASAIDASTAYSNPAGMVLIPDQQLVLSENAIITDIKFQGSETWSTNNNQVPLPLVPSNFSSTQTGTAQAGVTKFVPAFHYVTPLSDKWAFGLSLTSPYGLVTDYGNDSIVGYSGTETDLKTIDIAPSLAFKATDKFSVGAGLDIEHLDAILDGMVGAPYNAAALGYDNNALNTQSVNEGDGWGYGWHAGLLYQLTPETRLGLAYHSQVHFLLKGTSKLEGPLANQGNINAPGVINNNDLKTNVTLPPSTELSIHQVLNQQWSVDGSVIYTQWNYFNNVLHVQNVQGVTQASAVSPLQPATFTVNMPNYFRNTWRFAVGANYKPTQKWILRAGAGYDQSPVKEDYRGVRLPDANRYALAVGAHYQALKTLGVDVGWTHLFIQNARINLNAVSGTQVANTNGTYSNHGDIIGAQLTWDIA